jgi:cold shock CspA family protein
VEIEILAVKKAYTGKYGIAYPCLVLIRSDEGAEAVQMNCSAVAHEKLKRLGEGSQTVVSVVPRVFQGKVQGLTITDVIEQPAHLVKAS